MSNLHLADDQLLLHASGELPASSGKEIGSHLECCSQCQDRLDELQSALAEFGQAHSKTLKAQLPSADEPRAKLEARLTELVAQEQRAGWLHSGWTALIDQRSSVLLAGAVLAACLLVAVRLHGPIDKSEPMPTALAHWEEPNLRLTPGAVVAVTENQICGTAPQENDPPVPVSLKRKVFELYGVARSQPDAYDVDYLITPELGGATDIRNLWPEPNRNTVWNAHVKDQLEEHLHSMVCHGDVDLATAQHDISTDWIAAYRKYFHADLPVAHNSSSDFSELRPPLPRT
jgi:anti-sigma factor RsiW